jgi:hypothetical protein
MDEKKASRIESFGQHLEAPILESEMVLEVLTRNGDIHTELNDTEVPTFSAAFIAIASDADVTRRAGGNLGLSLPCPCGAREGSAFVATNLHGTTDSIRVDQGPGNVPGLLASAGSLGFAVLQWRLVAARSDPACVAAG